MPATPRGLTSSWARPASPRLSRRGRRATSARRALEAAQKSEQKAARGIDLAEVGYDEIRELELLVKVKERSVEQARRALEAADNDLAYTRVRAPFPGVVVKRYRHLGDFSPAGSPLLSIYDPDLLYVEANLEEDRLPGVEPGNSVRIGLDAFAEPFRGRVVWVNKSTGAQFALMPRNVVSGEFTRVVQRVPVRIRIERDDRWPRLRAGLSATVAIAHGPGDPAWASAAARAMSELETRYNASASPGEPAPRRGPVRHGPGGDAMRTLIVPPPTPSPEPPMRLGRKHWLAALAILFMLFVPYQTLVQTVITDDAVRKGVEADEYDMTWITVAYGVGVLYGLFAGLSLSFRIGKRYTLVVAMLVFSVGNVLCGAATGLASLAVARFIEGFGKMLAMVHEHPAPYWVGHKFDGPGRRRRRQGPDLDQCLRRVEGRGVVLATRGDGDLPADGAATRLDPCAHIGGQDLPASPLR